MTQPAVFPMSFFSCFLFCRSSHSSRASAGVLIAACGVSAGVLAMPVRAAAQPSPKTTRILVMPFVPGERDPRLVWLSEASAVLITDTLTAYGFPVLARSDRVDAFEDLNLPADASLSQASIIRVGELVAASDIITGTLRLSGAELVVEARRLRLDTGRLQQQVTDRAPLRELFGLHERVTKQLMGGAAVSVSSHAGSPPPLEAFEQYIKGLLAEQTATQIRFLQGALTAFPQYDRAKLALWKVYAEQSDHTRALAIVQSIPPDSRRARQAKFLAGLSLLELKRNDEAFQTFKTLLDEQPMPGLYNNLGIVQVRRGSTPTSGKATYYFTKASDADPDESDYFFNLGYTYWLDKDTQAAIYWLREAVRRNPADGEAHFVLGAALQAAGSQTEATREKDLARQLNSKFDEWTKRAAATSSADPVPRGLERVSPDLETLKGERFDRALLNSAQREQQELATFHLQRGRLLFQQEQNTESLAELRKSVYLSPYQAEPHLLMGRIYLRMGRPREAVGALRVSIWSQETLDARLALAQALVDIGEGAAARVEAQRALELSPASTDAKALLARIDQMPKK